MNNTVSIVVLNWNGELLLQTYLPAVLAAAAGAEVIVVDDGSMDSSCEFIRRNFPSVRLIAKSRHEGFASSANAGVSAVKGDVVVLLNTDVKPQKDFLVSLMPHFRDPKVFAVGCLEKSYEDGVFVERGRGEARWRHGILIHWRGDVNRSDTAWVSGGSGAFRKSLWQKLGGMDPMFNPFYWEDIDLSYRALKAGYRLVFEPKSIVEHYHEEGKIRKNFSDAYVKRIAYRNQFLFTWKNLSDPMMLLAQSIYTPFLLVTSLIRGDMQMIIGYLLAFFKLPTFLRSRRSAARHWVRADKHIYH